MGGAGSKDGINKQTIRLHDAIAAWNIEAVGKEIAAGAQVNAYKVITAEQRFAVWDAGRQPKATETYAQNALGKLLSEVYLILEQPDKPVPFTGKLLADTLQLLVDGGGDPNGVIEKFGVGQLDHGSATVADAMRKILDSASDPAQRVKRGTLLASAYSVLLRHASFKTVWIDDMMAWFAAKQVDVVTRIVNHGSVTFRNGREAPALTAAVDLGNLPLVKTIIELGVDINALDSQDTTALMHVTGDWDTRSADDDSDVRRPTIALAELLLQHNADVSIKDSRGRTALHHFAASKCTFLDTAARHFVCLRLIRSGLLPFARDNASWCAFDCAADRKDTFLIKAMAAENTWLRRRDAMLLWGAHTPLRAKASAPILSVK